MHSIDDFKEGMDNQVICEVFNSYYPHGTISSISLDRIPTPAMKFFELYSKRFILSKTYKKRDFEQAFVITHDSLEKSYIVRQTRTYFDNGQKRKSEPEKLTYIADMECDSMMTAYGELRFIISSKDAYFKDKPFAGYNGYEKPYPLRDGYSQDLIIRNWIKTGTRQLLVMNALSHAFFGLPLHSDTLITSEEAPLWDDLLKREKVIQYIEPSEYNHKRYFFNESDFKIYNHQHN